jgi:hypothetical protein
MMVSYNVILMHLWWLELGRFYFVAPTLSLSLSLSLPLSPFVHLSPFSLPAHQIGLRSWTETFNSSLGAPPKPLIWLCGANPRSFKNHENHCFFLVVKPMIFMMS